MPPVGAEFTDFVERHWTAFQLTRTRNQSS